MAITPYVNSSVSSSGGGGVPDDGSVTNVKVAANAAISLDKTADGTRLALSVAERTKLTGVATGATANSPDSVKVHVVVYSGGAYPARPSGLVGGQVRYIGPVQPADWVSNDEWVDSST